MNQLFGCHHLKVRPSSICDRAAKVICADTSMWDSFPWAYMGPGAETKKGDIKRYKSQQKEKAQRI